MNFRNKQEEIKNITEKIQTVKTNTILLLANLMSVKKRIKPKKDGIRCHTKRT